MILTRELQIVSFRPRWERRGRQPRRQSCANVKETFLEGTSEEQKQDDDK